ncbi:MAG: class I SAM-dependent methyltransferase [Flavobacteriaceae bacterium]|nr:class I SAM-dependent methyltransferase [Flavobacteriaceae bacterium]
MALFPRMMGEGLPSIVLNPIQIRVKQEVANKVKTGEYDFESVFCAVCNADNPECIAERDRYGLYFSVCICKQCGFVYTNPRMTQSAYSAFYDNEYRPLYVGSEVAGEAFFREQQKQGKRIYEFLDSANQISTRPMRVLEVGCGAGGILDFFRSKGHEVMGIDLGSEYVNYGSKNHSLDLRVSTLADFYCEDAIDLIVYSHVMEHILDLYAEIKAIRCLCSSQTKLYIEVPGIKNIHKNYSMDAMTYYQNAHAYHFTLHSIRALLKPHGFAMIAGNEYVKSVFSIGNDSFSQRDEYQSVLYYFRWNERFRWLFPLSIAGVKRTLKRIKDRLMGN